MVTIITITNVIMNVNTMLIKSCKKINSSIIGELASCRPNCLQVIILSPGAEEFSRVGEGHMNMWIYGYMDIWIYGYMDIWING